MSGGVVCAFGCDVECSEVFNGLHQEVLYEFRCKHGAELRSRTVKQQLWAKHSELPRSFTRPLHELKYIQTTRVPRSLLLFNRKRKDPLKRGFVP